MRHSPLFRGRSAVLSRTVVGGSVYPVHGAEGSPRQATTGRNLAAVGYARSDDPYAAHHIVPSGCGERAQPARDALSRFGIAMDSAENGVFVPAGPHGRMHTGARLDPISARLGRTGSRAEAVGMLSTIRAETNSGFWFR